jgi:hypothetical protein
MLLAQSLGEYGGGNVIGRLLGVFDAAVQWLQTSLQEDRTAWIVGVVCIVIVWFLFRRR